MSAPEPVTKTQTLREFEGVDWIDDGYEFMAAGTAAGWSAVAAWGKDGWDLGSWPYVVVLFRDRIVKPSTLDNDPAVKAYERATYLEGDVTVETFATADDREKATDETALFYWKADGADWLDRGDDLRGPYSRSRRTS